MTQLFRPEAASGQQFQWLGKIVLVRPVSFSCLTAAACLIAAVIIAFFVWGTYTKRSTVAGQLVPDKGLIKLYAPQQGVVKNKFVVEGQRVEEGEALFHISVERKIDVETDALSEITARVSARIEKLHRALVDTRKLQVDERKTLQLRVDSLVDEITSHQELIETQRQLVLLSESKVDKYKTLFTRGFVAEDQIQVNLETLLDQRSRLQSQERALIALERQLAEERTNLASIAVKHEIQLGSMQRELAREKQELAETEARRAFIIVAPAAGVATAVLVEQGQLANTSRPLVSIIPEGSILQAMLYAPSSAIGFVRPGDSVRIRYQPFPYQKFGHALGVVMSTSKTAISGDEIPSIGGFFNFQSAQGEPIYSIRVALAEQTMLASGKQEALQAGMLLEADIMRETRRLYEWVLEPLYNLTGKL